MADRNWRYSCYLEIKSWNTVLVFIETPLMVIFSQKIANFRSMKPSHKKKNTTKMTMNLWNQFRFHQIWKYVTWNHFWFHKNWLTFILRLVIRFWWLKLARLKIADNNRQQFWDASVFLRWAKITQTGWKNWQNAPKVTLSRMCLKPTIWLKSIHLSFEK